jgi:hypothetical protein
MKTSNKILLGGFTFIVILMLIGLVTMRSMFNATIIQGDGDVTELQRGTSSFERVVIRGNFQVYYTLSETAELTVIADANLHEYISTEVRGNELIIRTTQPIRSRKDLRVNIGSPNLSFVEASAAAGFFTTQPLELQKLGLLSNAGARMDVTGNFDNLDVTQNAGSRVKLSGTAQHLVVTSNAGGNVDAIDLEAVFARVEANAGASITVNAQEIDASANAGGSIRYSGNPSFRSMNSNAGGSISRQN